MKIINPKFRTATNLKHKTQGKKTQHNEMIQNCDKEEILKAARRKNMPYFQGNKNKDSTFLLGKKKAQTTKQEKLFAKVLSDKEFVCIFFNFQNSLIRKQSNFKNKIF